MRRASELKRMRQTGQLHQPLAGKTLGMIFEKASTRTRVSFEVGMYELGGHAVYLATQGSQIGRGEPLRDTARVLAGYCHGIVIRTFGHDVAEELARFAPMPVINGLTDLSHPCQVLADLFTAWERLGPGALEPGGARFAWIGDGNNMAHSWIEAAAILGLDLSLACPEGYDPDAAVLGRARTRRRLARAHRRRAPSDRGGARPHRLVDRRVGVDGRGGRSRGARSRRSPASPSTTRCCSWPAPDVIVLHCLPAHRGEEITDGVLEGPHSAVFQQAENRLHVQKAILERLLAPR